MGRPVDQGPAFGGSHGRAVCYSGMLNPSTVLQSEIDGEYDVYVGDKMERRSGRPKGDIMVSGILLVFYLRQKTNHLWFSRCGFIYTR